MTGGPKPLKTCEIAQRLTTRWSFEPSCEYKKLLLIARVLDIFAHIATVASRSLLKFFVHVTEVKTVLGVLSDPLQTHPEAIYGQKCIFQKSQNFTLPRPV